MNNNVAVNINSKSKAGRPAKDVSLILNKSFTLNDLRVKNPEVKSITLRAHTSGSYSSWFEEWISH